MSAIMMTVESVRTRAGTQEALLTLAVPLEQADLVAKFMGMIGKQVGVAFAMMGGEPVLTEDETAWASLPSLTRSAITICKEPLFQKFVAESNSDPLKRREPSEALAATYIKEWCHVATRKDLEKVDGARERFGALMAQYREWQHRDGRRKTH